ELEQLRMVGDHRPRVIRRREVGGARGQRPGIGGSRHPGRHPLEHRHAGHRPALVRGGSPGQLRGDRLDRGATQQGPAHGSGEPRRQGHGGGAGGYLGASRRSVPAGDRGRARLPCVPAAGDADQADRHPPIRRLLVAGVRAGGDPVGPVGGSSWRAGVLSGPSIGWADMRRALLWSAIVLTALVLQSTLFAKVTLAGAKPELVYMVTIILAFLEGPSSGAVAGFAGGMAEGFLLNQPKGITALTLTLVGYAVGTLRQYIVTPSPLLPVALVGGATTGGLLFYGLVSFLLGQLDYGGGYLIQIALLSGLYNAILTPFFFPIVRRVAESSRAKKVFRWGVPPRPGRAQEREPRPHSEEGAGRGGRVHVRRADHAPVVPPSPVHGSVREGGKPESGPAGPDRAVAW